MFLLFQRDLSMVIARLGMTHIFDVFIALFWSLKNIFFCIITVYLGIFVSARTRRRHSLADQTFSQLFITNLSAVAIRWFCLEAVFAGRINGHGTYSVIRIVGAVRAHDHRLAVDQHADLGVFVLGPSISTKKLNINSNKNIKLYL